MGQNVHNYTVQCVLPWNLFNEKIYIFLWWWLVVVVAMSILGFLVWCVTLLPNSNVRFVSVLHICTLLGIKLIVDALSVLATYGYQKTYLCNTSLYKILILHSLYCCSQMVVHMYFHKTYLVVVSP